MRHSDMFLVVKVGAYAELLLKEAAMKITRNILIFMLFGVCALGCLPAVAQDDASPSGPILFTNVNVFHGVSDKLITNANVAVTDNKITAVSTEQLAVARGHRDRWWWLHPVLSRRAPMPMS